MNAKIATAASVLRSAAHAAKVRAYRTAHRREFHLALVGAVGIGLYFESHLADWLFFLLALTFEAPEA